MKYLIVVDMQNDFIDAALGTAEAPEANNSSEAVEEQLFAMSDEEEFYAEAEENDLSAADIYERACSQVVSVAVEMVSYDLFGNQTPSVVSGSGFLISEDGYILTNYHVVEQAIKKGINVTITTYDGAVFVGRIVGSDEGRIKGRGQYLCSRQPVWNP